jgi:hypothetical protein
LGGWERQKQQTGFRELVRKKGTHTSLHKSNSCPDTSLLNPVTLSCVFVLPVLVIYQRCWSELGLMKSRRENPIPEHYFSSSCTLMNSQIQNTVHALRLKLSLKRAPLLLKKERKLDLIPLYSDSCGTEKEDIM